MFSEHEIQEVVLDGVRMTSKEDAHGHMKQQFGFPEYYGHNLDALWDLLTTWSDPLYITLIHSEAMYENLGAYGVQLMDVFREAAEQNEKLRFQISHESDFYENVLL